jgi:hypothetical protein
MPSLIVILICISVIATVEHLSMCLLVTRISFVRVRVRVCARAWHVVGKHCTTVLQPHCPFVKFFAFKTGSCDVAHVDYIAGVACLMLLPQPPKYWDQVCVPPCLVLCSFLGGGLGMDGLSDCLPRLALNCSPLDFCLPGS